MTTPIEVQRIVLRDERRPASSHDEAAAALYVMVTAHRRHAKVGALEKAVNAEQRLRTVEKAHRIRSLEPDSYPLRVAVVAEIQGLVLGPYEHPAFAERWAEVEHLESALRLVLARRLGRLSEWSDWIHLDEPVEFGQWARHVTAAWREVSKLGRG